MSAGRYRRRVRHSPGNRSLFLSRYAPEVVVAAYAGAVVGAPGLTWRVLAAVALLSGVAAALVARDRGLRDPAVVAVAWAPVHLAVLATGGAGSLATPLLPAWAAWAGTVERRRWTVIGPGAAAVLLVGTDAWAGAWSVAGLAEGVLALALGAAGGALWKATTRRDAQREKLLDRILLDAEAEGGASPRAAAARRLDGLAQAVDMVRSGLEVRRAVVWDVDAATERARPRAVSGGAAPPDIHLAGSPLRWIWEETMPVRLDVPPTWALDDARVGAVAVMPGHQRNALLTLEWDDEAEIGLGELAQASHYLRMYAQLELRTEAAEISRVRFEEMLAFIRALPNQTRLDAFGDALARTATTISEGTGALVARRDGESARVVAVAGRDGGPAVGTYTDGGSSCDHALRTGSVIRRQSPAGAGHRPLVRSGERWHAEPVAVVTIPLLDENADARGLLAVWNSREPDLDPDAMELLEVFAPIFALQLQQGSDLVALRERADNDALTGLSNRTVLDRELEEAGKLFRRYRRACALLVMDIDHFKAINDTHGHAAGDAVLRVVGDIVKGAIREVDVAARYGGEEFVVLLPETMRAAATDVAERLRETVEETTVHFGGEEIRIRASFGVSACPECVEEPRELMASADAMLYRSKQEGRNRVTVAPVV